jgi:hypothetical protein
MSFAVVCHICSARLTVPEGFKRDKMRCPQCGVLCPVPHRPAEKKKSQRPVEEIAPREADQPATPVREPATPVRSAPPQPVMTFLKELPEKGLATCLHCGESVRPPKAKRGRRGRCPVCGCAWQLPAGPARSAPPPMPVPPPPDEFAGSTPDDDPESGNPYRTADAGARRCPGCTKLLGPEVVVCVRCGFDLRTGRKITKEYQPFERSWNSGMPFAARLLAFLGCQALALVSVGAGFAAVDDSPVIKTWTFGLCWLVYTLMTGFLLGTFDHFDLKRYRSGRVDLTRRWRVGFIPWPAWRIDVRDYWSVITGARNPAGMLEWFVFVFLLGFGLMPALLYWYCAIYKTEYTVALTSFHGQPGVNVYRGWSQAEMQEIKDTLQTAMTV